MVYAKRPFGGPQQVLDYLGRYTHRVAIANSRLLTCENGRVHFRWKDYRADNKSRVMTLEADEFALGMSDRSIAQSLGIGKSTVGEYVCRAKVIGITWPVPEEPPSWNGGCSRQPRSRRNRSVRH